MDDIQVIGVTTTYAYDAWGRMTAKSAGTASASYHYHYAYFMTKATSTFSGEGTVSYEVGADGSRRQRDDGAITKYRWEDAWNVISEEDSAGTLAATRIEGLADVVGSNPGTGSYRYYSWDHLGSTRRLRDQTKSPLVQYEYTAYGSDYALYGAAVSRGFAGYDRDLAIGAVFVPLRYYSVVQLRWLTRDPLGLIDGPNLYEYVRGNPVHWRDPYGAFALPLVPIAGAIVGGILGAFDQAVRGCGGASIAVGLALGAGAGALTGAFAMMSPMAGLLGGAFVGAIEGGIRTGPEGVLSGLLGGGLAGLAVKPGLAAPGLTQIVAGVAAGATVLAGSGLGEVLPDGDGYLGDCIIN